MGEKGRIVMLKLLKNELFFGIQNIFSPINTRNIRLSALNISDREAIMSDWRAVGNDIRGAMTAYDREKCASIQ